MFRVFFLTYSSPPFVVQKNLPLFLASKKMVFCFPRAGNAGSNWIRFLQGELSFGVLYDFSICYGNNGVPSLLLVLSLSMVSKVKLCEMPCSSNQELAVIIAEAHILGNKPLRQKEIPGLTSMGKSLLSPRFINKRWPGYSRSFL